MMGILIGTGGFSPEQMAEAGPIMYSGLKPPIP